MLEWRDFFAVIVQRGTIVFAKSRGKAGSGRGAGAGALRDHVVATQFGERTRREEGATTAGAEPVHVLQSWDATPLLPGCSTPKLGL